MQRLCVERILLLKAPKEDGNDPYLKVLTDQGYTSECVGVLGFQFVNLNTLEKCLKQPESYSAILLTSQRAVEAVSKVVGHFQEKTWKSLPAYVVGQATANLASKVGFCTLKGSDSGNAENLARIIVKDFSESSQTILFPCGNIRKETLPFILTENNIKFENMTVYETAADQNLKDNLKQYVSKGPPDIVVFFSPSGVQYTSKLWPDFGLKSNELKCVAIGPSTGESLRENGFNVMATASQPTPESLLHAIDSIIRREHNM